MQHRFVLLLLVLVVFAIHAPVGVVSLELKSKKTAASTVVSVPTIPTTTATWNHIRSFRAGAIGPTRGVPSTIPSIQDRYRSTTTIPPQHQNEEVVAKEVLNSFLTRDSRQTFIARVYAILAVQLLVTTASILFFGLHPNWTRMILYRFGMTVPMLSLLLSTAAWLTMSISVDARRATPIKWQLLTLFTIGEAVSVGIISSFYTVRSVLSAVLITAVTTLSVSLYTANQRNPKYDLSQWGSTISSFGLLFVIYGFITLLMMTGVLPHNFLPYSDMLYGLLGATLFSFYLAYHTKLIVSGKHAKYQMNEKDYVFGAS